MDAGDCDDGCPHERSYGQVRRSSDDRPFRILGDPAAPILIIADHASNHVPDGIDLGLPPEVMGEHVALDIGVAEVAALLVETGQCCAILGGVSRLVIDYNREPDAAGLVPVHSDGHHIEGNSVAEVARAAGALLRTLSCRGRPAGGAGAPAFHPVAAQLHAELAQPAGRGTALGNRYPLERGRPRAPHRDPLLEAAGLMVGANRALFGQASQCDDEPPRRSPWPALSRRRDEAGSCERYGWTETVFRYFKSNSNGM